jgi:signal transduction histidine kinase
MATGNPSWERRYIVAVLAFALACFLTLLLWPLKEKGAFILFLAAVSLSAWYGGVSPGVVTTALSAIAGTYIFLPPNYSLLVEDLGSSLRLMEFLLVSALIITLSGLRRSALRLAEVARAQAEKANRAKDDFLAMVTHDLRTPLSAILGWTQMLRKDPSEGTRTRAIEVIERNARSQQHLIDDLLDVSRIINGTLRLELNEVNLNEVVKAAIDVLRPAADEKNIHVKTMLDAGSGHVLGDARRLEQVVWNLLSNAIKFTHKGGHVTVQLDNMFTYVRLTVSDTGKGISEEFLPYVFDRFRQEDGAEKLRQGGLGLGLTIVSRIVEMHGGTAQVESGGIGRGTTFTVRLPLAASQESGSVDPGLLHTATRGVIKTAITQTR